MKTTKLILAALAAAKCVTLAHVGDTEDQVRARFEYPPIDQGHLTFLPPPGNPQTHEREGSYLCFLENGWLVGIHIIEGKSVMEKWSRTSVANWTSKPISSEDIERLRKEYGVSAISPGLWGNATTWMRYDERHYAIWIAAYDFYDFVTRTGKKPTGDVWPSLPTWYYREIAREFSEKAPSDESRKKSEQPGVSDDVIRERMAPYRNLLSRFDYLLPTFLIIGTPDVSWVPPDPPDKDPKNPSSNDMKRAQ